MKNTNCAIMRLVVICIEFFTLEYIFSSQIGHKIDKF